MFELYCKDLFYCVCVSFFAHFAFLLLFWLISLLNFSSNPIDINISEKPVIVRIGEIRNTRMKELDKIHEVSNDKISSVKNNEKNLSIEKKNYDEKVESNIEKKIENKLETNLIKKNNQKNPLELKKKKINKIKNSNNNKINKKLNQKNSKIVEHKKKNTMFDTIEDISDNYSSIRDCKSISDVYKLQFKNDVIEFIKANWNIPDYLIGKDLKISVIIVFDKNGYIVNYEIKEYPKNDDYEILVESIKELFFSIKKKPLPVNGRKLSFNSIIFTFSPIYN